MMDVAVVGLCCGDMGGGGHSLQIVCQHLSSKIALVDFSVDLLSILETFIDDQKHYTALYMEMCTNVLQNCSLM